MLSDNIVISGLGCRLPGAQSIEELSANILAGKNLLPGKKLNHVDLNRSYRGEIADVYKFDNNFFGISAIQTRGMDIGARMTLEAAFEAIVDAGLNPSDFKGSDTIVYTGYTFGDLDIKFFDVQRKSEAGYQLMGNSKAIHSNRISFWLDAHGTSVNVGPSWCSSIKCLELAVESIRLGRCSAAIIAMSEVAKAAEIEAKWGGLIKCPSQGRIKVFDDTADGSIKSDGVVVLLLQRESHAKRCYAVVNDAFSSSYFSNIMAFKPSQQHWADMLHKFYSCYSGDKNDLCYLETSCEGIKVNDAEELNAVAQVICQARNEPLLVGSIKSNLGNTQNASGSVGILKAIMSFHTGRLHHNYNFKNPNHLCPGLLNGQLKVVDANMELPKKRSIAVNAVGFNGSAYGHAVLSPNLKQKDVHYDGVPRLVLLASRIETYMPEIIDKVESMQYDPEFIGLLHEVYTRKLASYLCRGYTILPKPAQGSQREFLAYSEVKRPVWFIFAGMGSQWPSMGKDMMTLPIFRESIEKSCRTLKPLGVDLLNIITTSNPAIFDNILHSFVGIAAIQIALVDVLNALHIVPDGIIGHSVGEFGCAYADGCLTAEQMILGAYYRGLASIETKVIKGYMAAIGKGYNEIKDDLPDDIEVACHNAANSCTLSGPAESVQQFVAELQSRGVFARTVNVADIAYHSRYIQHLGPKLLQYLSKIITEPKARSEKWICTSHLEKDWDKDLARYNSAEYHTNNLLSPVYFEEGSKHIPKDAICIEIAPHGLLQAILKRSLSSTCTNVPLTNRTAGNSLYFLLKAVGKLYSLGLHPQVQNLYPRVEFPVSQGTPSLHQLVRWQHQEDFILDTSFFKEIKNTFSLRHLLIEVSKSNKGYKINNYNCVPLSIIVYLIWDTFVKINQRSVEECAVVIEKLQLHQGLPHVGYKDIHLHFGVQTFELRNDREEMLVTGKITLIDDYLPKVDVVNDFEDESVLKEQDLTDYFQARGLGISPAFRVLNSVRRGTKFVKGQMPVSSTVLETLEGLIQLALYNGAKDARFNWVPKAVERISIVPKQHREAQVRDSACIRLQYEIDTSTAIYDGIQVKNMRLEQQEKELNDPLFTVVNFVPYKADPAKDVACFLHNVCHLVRDNKPLGTDQLHVFAVDNKLCTKQLHSLEFPVHQTTELTSQVDLVIVPSPKQIPPGLRGGAFVLLNTQEADVAESMVFVTRSSSQVGLTLLQKVSSRERLPCRQYTEEPNSAISLLSYINHLPSTDPICVVFRREPAMGLLNFKTTICAHTEKTILWFLLLDTSAPEFNPEDQFYKEQIEMSLSVNVYQSGAWGYMCGHNMFLRETQLNAVGKDFVVEYVAVDNETDLRLPEGCQVEYSGNLGNGSRVMGLATCVKGEINRDKYLTWEVPHRLRSDEAACTSRAYAQAYYALVVVGKLANYETVLITDAYTTDGLAAIAVAIPRCRDIIATVASQDQATLLTELFPQINKNNILFHSNFNFGIKAMFLNNSVKVTLAYNSLNGKHMVEALHCVGTFGRFFHLGRDDVKRDSDLGSHIFLNNLAFFSIDPHALTMLREDEKQQINQLLLEGIKTEEVRTLPHVVSDLSEVKQISNVLKHQLRHAVAAGKPVCRGVDASKGNSFIIIDDSGLWQGVAEQLAERGVQRIHVVVQEEHVKPRRDLGKTELVMYGSGQAMQLVQNAINHNMEPLVATIIISLTTPQLTEAAASLATEWYSGGHLIAISTDHGQLSHTCAKRQAQGYPSTNFILNSKVDDLGLLVDHLLTLSGEEPLVYVTDKQRDVMLNAGLSLVDILPRTLDEYCGLGASLTATPSLVELPTRTGVYFQQYKESPLLVIVPGLQGDPTASLRECARSLMYPTFVATYSSVDKFSVVNTAASLKQEIIKLGSRRSVNLVGVAWGTTLAIETAKQLEDKGYRVSLVLVDGPLTQLRDALLHSGPVDQLLLQFLPSSSHKGVESNSARWESQIEQVLSTLNVPASTKQEVEKAIHFLHSSLESLVEYDFSALPLQGTVTVVRSRNWLGIIDRTLTEYLTTEQLDLPLDQLLLSHSFQQILDLAPIFDAMEDINVTEPYRNFKKYIEARVPSYSKK